MPKEYKILLSIALGAIILGVVLFKFIGQSATQTPLVQRQGMYSLGSENAKITLTEFADFQCPACRSANDIPGQILAAYPNQVKFVFRHFPLSSHPFAMISAQAAEAAGAQGKFWEMHDLLYEKQDEWGNLTSPLNRDGVLELYKGYARQIGINDATFAQAVSANAFADVINQDMSAGSASGVNATPSFYVNNVLVDEPSFAAIKKEIDTALAQ